METQGEKSFIIGRDGQYVVVGYGLGRILMRQEIDDIVGRFGSVTKKSIDGNYIGIIPPISEEELPKLGEALVQLALDLDPSDPLSTYKIT